MNYKLNALTLLIFSTGLAQVNFTNPDETAVVSYQTKEIDLSKVKTEGSPYFEEEFKRGKIYMNGQEKIVGNLRYNASNSEIELQRGNSEYTSVLKRNNISVSIGNKLYKLLPYKDEDNASVRTGYFIAMNNGRATLLFKPEKKLRRGRTPSTSYDRLVPPRYIDVSAYYIQIDEEPATKIYLRKNEFYKILGKDKVQEYTKTNNLKLNHVDDAIKLMDYYNENIISKL